LADFLNGWRFFAFGAPSFEVEDGVSGLGRGFASATSTPGHPSANSNMRGGGMMVGKLVSKSTRSGNLSAELIKMAGLPLLETMGSETACGRSQFNPSNNSKRALPTKPKYLIKGIGGLLLRRPLGSYCW
jgi:hypothetical protein